MNIGYIRNIFSNNTARDYLFINHYKNVAEFVLKKLGLEEKTYIISLTLVDEATSLDINKKFRNKDYVADVISFAYLDDEKEETGEVLDLGELILCPDKILERAKEVDNDFDEEMIYLYIHGLLHLLGYDHVNDPEEAKIMYNKQDELFDIYKKERINDR